MREANSWHENNFYNVSQFSAKIYNIYQQICFRWKFSQVVVNDYFRLRIGFLNPINYVLTTSFWGLICYRRAGEGGGSEAFNPKNQS